MARMELEGMYFDEVSAREMQSQILRRMDSVQKEAVRILGTILCGTIIPVVHKLNPGHDINLASPSEVSKALFQELAIPFPGQGTDRKARRQLSTTKDVNLRKHIACRNTTASSCAGPGEDSGRASPTESHSRVAATTILHRQLHVINVQALNATTRCPYRPPQLTLSFGA